MEYVIKIPAKCCLLRSGAYSGGEGGTCVTPPPQNLKRGEEKTGKRGKDERMFVKMLFTQI